MLFAANALQCIVNAEESPKTVSFTWDFVNLPEEDWATAIGNMHRKVAKIAHVVPEISWRTDRQTHRQTDVFITILRHRSRGRFIHDPIQMQVVREILGSILYCPPLQLANFVVKTNLLF